MRAWVYLLFFASGFTGLLYEIVWIRAAGTVLGNTTTAIGTVIGVYMGGMALGAWRGGRAADRRSGGALLRLYGILEGGVALGALAVPWLLDLSLPLFRALWDGAGTPGPVYGALRVAVPALILAVPTTLMGATLPVLARWFTQSVDGAAREAGKAYALNTFGGVAGTLAAGFWLVPAFGLRITTAVAVLMNLGIAATAVALARGGARAALPPAGKGAPLPRLILAVAAASGLAALIYEVAWTRLIVLALGSTVYSFTIVLAVFIFGLAAGSALGARVLGKTAAPARALAAIQLAIGVLAVVSLPFLGQLPVFFASVTDALKRSFDGLLWAQAGLVALFILPPALLMGAVFPFACRLCGAAGEEVGRGVAGVYAWNTLGAILGTFAASFLIIPAAGPGVAVKAAVTVNMAAAALLLWRDGARGAVALPAAVLGVTLFLPPLSSVVLSSGAYLYGSRIVRSAQEAGRDVRSHLEMTGTLLDERWDAYGLVTVHQNGPGQRMLRINGKVDASTNGPDMVTQQWLAHLPLLHHPAPRKVAVVGLGAGITAGTAAAYGVDRVDCVELSPAVAALARHFAEVNGNCLDDPRVRLTLGDGRHFVRCARERFDVVICEPSNLWLSGMANLFTQDFFRETAGALAPGGIVCQWVHAYRLSSEDFRSVLRTFFSVFPGGGVWEVVPGGDYLLLGRSEPGPMAWPDFEARVKAAASRAPELLDPFLPPAISMASTLVADAEAVRAGCGDVPLLSDDHCPIEFTAPRWLHREHRDEILGWLDGLRIPEAGVRVYGGLGPEAEAHLSSRRAARRAVSASMRLYLRPPPEDPGPHRVDPRGPEAMALLEQAVRAHGPDRSSRLLLEERAQELAMEAKTSEKAGHPDVAQEYLKAIPRGTGPYAEARTSLGKLRLAKQDVEGARQAFRESLEAAPRALGAAVGWALSAQALLRHEEALEAWTRATALDPANATAHMGRAASFYHLGRAEESRAACRKVLELKPDDPSARELLKRLDLDGR